MDTMLVVDLLRAELAPIKREIRALASHLGVVDAQTSYSHVKTRRYSPEPEPFPNAAKPENPDAKTHYCSFCGKDQHEVGLLIAGPGNFICNECVDLCATILRQKAEKKAREGSEERAPTS